MKTLILGITLATFACLSAVQAGEDCDKSKAACSDKAKTACGAQSACCASGAKTAQKKADTSVKGATLLVRK